MLSESVAASIRHYLSRIECVTDFTIWEIVDYLIRTFFFLFLKMSCFGCCSKTTPIIAVDEPAKGLRIQGRTVQKASSSDGFWSSSPPCHLENSALQSQRSISSSVSTVTLNHSSTMGSMNSNNSEFVNHGLVLWNENRQQWTGSDKSRSRTRQKAEGQLSLDATYESLLTSRSPFTQPVPLSEMVEFLVKVWEQEGMYD